MPIYRMRYRPVGAATLPSNLYWEWVELPPDHPNPHCFPHIPRSDHRFGTFRTERPLTRDELDAFQIEEGPDLGEGVML